MGSGCGLVAGQNLGNFGLIGFRHVPIQKIAVQIINRSFLGGETCFGQADRACGIKLLGFAVKLDVAVHIEVRCHTSVSSGYSSL